MKTKVRQLGATIRTMPAHDNDEPTSLLMKSHAFCLNGSGTFDVRLTSAFALPALFVIVLILGLGPMADDSVLRGSPPVLHLQLLEVAHPGTSSKQVRLSAVRGSKEESLMTG
jgi:hypothetical protein